MTVQLTQLSSLIQEISQMGDAANVVHLIVQRVQEIMEVPVANLYLLSEAQDGLVLAATQGLRQESVGKIKLAIGEGLVGRIASTLHVLNLADATGHKKYTLFPESGEQPYKRFMGVPLIHLRELVGVLVVQGGGDEKFSAEEEALLVTIAAHLAATLSVIQQSDLSFPNPAHENYQRHTGIKGSSGVGVGELVVIGLTEPVFNDEEDGDIDPRERRAKFEKAIDALQRELETSGEQFDEHVSTDIASLFSVYRMMLDSPEFIGAIRVLIDGGLAPHKAVKQISEQLSARFRKAADPYMQARGEDVEHLGDRILHFLCGGGKIDIDRLGSELVLAGKMISIADVSQFPNERIKGLLCTSGSALSHTAIVASALGIPAVMGLTTLEPAKYTGEQVIVDGNRGVCITQPADAMIKAYNDLLDQLELLDRSLEVLKEKPAVTQDGFQIKLLANTGLLADVTPGLRNGAEGIGLYRSEIPFMVRDNFPTEEEQVLVYREVLAAYRGKPVCMRLLDIGGDKPLPYFSIREENPGLGWRGIRFDLDNTSILVIQMRAMLRAAIGLENLRILVPMVSGYEEIQTVRRLLEQVVEQLRAEGLEVKVPLLGIMLEVPSMVFLIPRMADLVDYVSVGTNDLTQYLLAVDRNNPKVSTMFDNLHPAMLLVLRQIIEQCVKAKLPVSICGEMASDPVAVLILIALGYNRLSLNAHNIPRIKWLIRAVDRSQLQVLLEQAMQLHHAHEVRILLEEELEELGWHMPENSAEQ